MKFSRELLLDAHQGTVLLDVSVLVGRDREEGGGGGWEGRSGLQTWQECSSRVPSASVSLWMNLKQVQSFDVTEQNSNKVCLIKGVTRRPQTFCCPSAARKKNTVAEEATPADIHTRGGANSASGPSRVHLKGLCES